MGARARHPETPLVATPQSRRTEAATDAARWGAPARVLRVAVEKLLEQDLHREAVGHDVVHDPDEHVHVLGAPHKPDT